jgi:hypothetical protein
VLACTLSDGDYRIPEPPVYASLKGRLKPAFAVVRGGKIIGFRSEKHLIIVRPREPIDQTIELEATPVDIGHFIPNPIEETLNNG